jgi:DNA repair protein RAD57
VSDNTNVASDSSLYDLTNDALNLDFQTSIISGWDTKTLYDYFDNSNNPVSVNLMELEMIKYELANSLQKNDRKTRNYQGELIGKLHTLDNVHTKRQVPTLGYLWGKRIATRILLMKTYKPLIDEFSKDVDDNKLAEDSSNPTSSLIDILKDIPKLQTIEALVHKWHLQRYVKVVSCNHNIYKNNRKVQFEIIQDGIKEVD